MNKTSAGTGWISDTRGSGRRKVDARSGSTFMRTRRWGCGVSEERSYLCVEALGPMRSEESENELDWLLSMGLMWATDLKSAEELR
jgi:hypothetical protein